MTGVEEAQQAVREGIHRAERSLMLNPVDRRALSLSLSARVLCSRMVSHGRSTGGVLRRGFTEFYANRQILAASLIDRERYWQIAARHLGSYGYFRHSPLFDVSMGEAGRNNQRTALEFFVPNAWSG
jgi:hypothetical protein